MGRLFGTDGVRGIANKELTAELAVKMGRAVAEVLTDSKNKKVKVMIGMDTRISCDMLACGLACGLCSVGADVLILGVVPTPAVSYLVNYYKYDAGIMISASHNSFEFNGIKIFKSDGYKLDDSLEDEIEKIISEDKDRENLKINEDIGRVSFATDELDKYIEHLVSCFDGKKKNLKIALDTANGSSSVCAEKIFKSLGFEVLVINDKPNGININDKAGSTHIDALKSFVKENNCDLGYAFDGDADRIIAVDDLGNEVDGDKIISICSLYLKELGKLNKNSAVVTVMSNMGFFKFAEENDIKCIKTKVGDRYVLEEMLKENYSIGGEQSGHVIFLDKACTGDGELTGVILLSAITYFDKSLSELASIMKTYPQVLVNINVSPEGKENLAKDEVVQNKISEVESILGDTGRILVRVSGTEPLIRVMLEGSDYNQIEKLANETAEVIEDRLS
ncbi:MAG: phosphoglucosamine mutase [Clostridia bacterium]|nr:phosphoglucosamine mutase [Clostridia bacterium]